MANNLNYNPAFYDFKLPPGVEWWKAFPTIRDPELGEIPMIDERMTDEQKEEVRKIVKERIEAVRSVMK